MTYEYKTKGTCSRQMEIEIDDQGIITNLTVTGGCNGNLKGIMALVKGRKAAEVAATLKGIQCGSRGTSCPDQLSICIEEALAAVNA